MCLCVCVMSTFRIIELLPTPGDKSQSSFRSQSALKYQSHGFKTTDKSSSIIIGSSLWSSIPRINVSSHEQYLVRSFRSLDFENQVIWVNVRYLLVLKDQMESDLLSSILHSLQHFGILYCDGSYRDGFAVLSSSMDGVDRKGSNRSDQCSYSSVFCSVVSSKYSILYWLIISCPLLIVDYDFAFHLIFSLLKLFKWSHHNGISFNVSNINITVTLRCFCLSQ